MPLLGPTLMTCWRRTSSKRKNCRKFLAELVPVQLVKHYHLNFELTPIPGYDTIWIFLIGWISRGGRHREGAAWQGWVPSYILEFNIECCKSLGMEVTSSVVDPSTMETQAFDWGDVAPEAPLLDLGMPDTGCSGLFL